MTGAVVVAACGHTALDHSAVADAAMRLADTAIALREFCSRLFDAGDDEDEDEDEFNLGLDAGAVFGGMLGRTASGSGGVFNLWGEAFRGAELLADSAPFRTIQVSEQSYLLLRKTFLFRPRGLFHRPGVGDARCYVLAGRA
jgi:adenylate cyclase